MAVAQLIDLSNYSTLLKQSTQSRSGTPDGNIYFDDANGRIELITKEELAQIDFGSGAEDNPFTNQDGIKFEALYAFENQERRTDETLRQYDRYFKGTFKFGGAYEMINARKFDDDNGTDTSTTTDDRAKVRGSGWIERDTEGKIGRIYYGIKSLGNIYSTSHPYYQLSSNGAPTSFAKAGAVDEAIQVYGDNSVDANTTTFDNRTFMVMKVRTFGNNYDAKQLSDSGVTQMDGYSSGFALGESPHLTTGDFNLSDVYAQTTVSAEDLGTGDDTTTDFTLANGYVVPSSQTVYVAGTAVVEGTDYAIDLTTGVITFGTAPASGDDITADYSYKTSIDPFKEMYIEKQSSAVTETGFKEGDGDFTWILRNPNNGSLKQCIAFLDAMAQTDDDIDYSSLTDTHGERVATWYSYNGAGKIVTKSGADSNGLFIENIPTADEQSIVFTADDASTRTRPFSVDISVAVGSFAVSDDKAWYEAFFLADYNTSSAKVVIDKAGNDVKGNVSTNAVDNDIGFAFGYDSDTVGGTAGTDKDVVFLCEGDGGATQAKTVFTITKVSKITASAEPSLETNV